MIYYDRRLPNSLLELLRLDSPAGWLVQLVSSGLDANARPHIQFRRNQDERSHGGIQVYFGRTSPLEIIGAAKNRVSFRADKGYVALSPDLFKMKVSGDDLLALRPGIEAHLRAASRMVNPCFVNGEAICHAGMMRRYGQGYVAGDPFVAVDSEVRAGFDSESEQNAFRKQERSALVSIDGAFPSKLDAVVVLASGALGIVELKAKGEDLRRAAVQAAVHVGVVREIQAQRGVGYLVNVVNGMLEQKARVGLLGNALIPRLLDDAPIVPIIAAPALDQKIGWADVWRKKVTSVLTTAGTRDRLAGLRLWRLSSEGELSEDVAA